MACLLLARRPEIADFLYRFELAAINRDTHFGEQVETPTKDDEPSAHLTNGPAIVLAEVNLDDDRRSASYSE